MGFVRTETWSTSKRGLVLPALQRWSDHRVARTAAALLISLSIEAAMIGALVFLGDIHRSTAARVERSITTFDIMSVTEQSQGATTDRPIQPNLTTAQLTKIDATDTPPIAREWSVVALPPAPKVSLPVPPLPTPAEAQHGLGSSGAGGGAGYDPYAFASYRPPSSGARSASAVIAPVQVIPEARAKLEALLQQRLGRQGLRLETRLTIDASGHVTHVDIVSGVPSSIVATTIAVVTGFLLCEADANRTSNVEVPLSLGV